MKTTVAPYATRAFCLRIVCKNGLTIRLTRYPFDLTMSNSQVYLAGSGYDLTAYSAASTMAPGAIDLEGFFGAAGITRDIIASGVFDNARAYLFAVNFLSPVEDYEPIMASTLGKTTLHDEKYIIEEMGLVDAFNQAVGDTYMPTCSHTFGVAGCGISLAAHTVTGTITSVTSGALFYDSARAEAADYFTAGSIVFTSGNNAGLRKVEIKAYGSGGAIALFEPCYYTPQIGDAYSMVRGCRKRKVDCQGYSNVVNAMAFWDMPTASQYAQVGGLK
jgi:uncharacterized phage protein (TIGR02218 family)